MQFSTTSSSVVDVYSAWCGPCKAVLSLFRRIKNELGDDLLHFAIAKSDTINSLEPYREHSEPTFLFFAVSVPFALRITFTSPLYAMHE